MKHFSAKTGNELPSRKTDKPIAFKRKIATVSVVLVSLFSAFGIYFLVGERGSIPPLPRVHIDKGERGSDGWIGRRPHDWGMATEGRNHFICS